MVCKVHICLPFKTLQDGFINDTKWKKEKDMSGELLTKVKRNNKIVVDQQYREQTNE